MQAAGGGRDHRASDADRERVAEVLRRAAGDGRLDLDELEQRLEAAYAARTYGELEPVVRDLPGAPPVVTGGPESTDTSVAGRVGGTPTSSVAVAICSGTERKGVWVVPRTFTALAMFGGIALDLRQARFESAEVVINASALFGGVDIVVPPDVDVRVEGIGVFGGYAQPPGVDVPPGSPVVRVRGLALFGGVDVRRRPHSGDGGERR